MKKRDRLAFGGGCSQAVFLEPFLAEALLCCLPIDDVPHCGEVFGLAVLILKAMHTLVLDEMNELQAY
jgi:hypothetical protein